MFLIVPFIIGSLALYFLFGGFNYDNKKEKNVSQQRVDDEFDKFIRFNSYGITYIESYRHGLSDTENKMLREKIRQYRIQQENKKLDQLRQEKEAEARRKYEDLLVKSKFESDAINYYLFELNDHNSSCPGVYMIYNTISKSYYIGSSRNIYNRRNQHLYNLRLNCHHNYKLQNLYNEYGESSTKFYALYILDLEKKVCLQKGVTHAWSDLTESKKRLRLLRYEQEFIDKFSPALNIHQDVYEYRGKYTKKL